MRKIGILFGAILGAVFGFLFAPRKGSEFRKRIKNDIKKGGTGLNALKEDAKNVGKDLSDTFNEIKESDEFKKAVKKGKTEMEKNLKKGKKELDKISDKAYSYGVKKSKELKKKINKTAGKKIKKTAKKVVKNSPLKKTVKKVTAKKK